MAKPFLLTFSYTPRWKKNRERDAADQIKFVLRDLQEAKRIAEQERIYNELVKPKDGKDGIAPNQTTPIGPEVIISISSERLSIVSDLVRRHVVSFDPFQVEDSEGQISDVKTFEDLREKCSDVIAELSMRLLNGPDAEELKN